MTKWAVRPQRAKQRRRWAWPISRAWRFPSPGRGVRCTLSAWASIRATLIWCRAWNARAPAAARAEDISAALAKLGIEGAYEGALSYAGNPDMVSRTHFARFLVEHGHCRDIHEVFDRYLGDGKPGYVPHRWSRLADAISWIKGAGGVAVMAHPGRYTLSLVEHSALFDEFKELGGEGVEVITGSHTPDQYALYADVARRYGLLASRGSDFHGPGEGRVELGTLPPLPDNLTPVWSRWMS